MRNLAILGGPPAADREIPINRPTLPTIDQVSGSIGEILESGQVTNNRFVRELEERIQEYCGAKHAIAVASCTSGLMLGLQALEVKKKVAVPSFTFPATAHAVTWNGLEPAFADCEEDTFNISPASAADLLEEEADALIAVPIFGNPVDGAALRRAARRRRAPVMYDAAHALGAKIGDKFVGHYADLTVFSLAPTKIVPAGEGGIVTTDDDELARRLRIGRNYGNPGNYDCEFPGLNARMSEFHAVMALFGLARLDEAIDRRAELVERYRARLEEIQGLGFQSSRPGDRCTHNYFAITVEPEPFGLDVIELERSLSAENIGCRRYFYPPLHRQRIYAGKGGDESRLQVTDRIADRVLCLPLYTHLEETDVDRVCDVIAEIQQQASKVRQVLEGPILHSVGGAR